MHRYELVGMHRCLLAVMLRVHRYVLVGCNEILLRRCIELRVRVPGLCSFVGCKVVSSVFMFQVCVARYNAPFVCLRIHAVKYAPCVWAG